MKKQIIKSKKLEKLGITHGTSTKSFGNIAMARDVDGRTDSNRLAFFGQLGIDIKKHLIIFPKLTHSSNVALVSSESERQGIISLDKNSPETKKVMEFRGINPPVDFIPNPEAGIDACVSKAERTFIAMMPADCAPIFIYDLATSYYALIHAGVLGAFSSIAANTIFCMEAWCSSKAENLVCYIGPSISAQAYKLKQSGLWNKVLKGRVDERTADNFDLKLFLRNQLINKGVNENNIEISPFCTAVNQDLFFSNYTVKSIKEKQMHGRHMAVTGKK